MTGYNLPDGCTDRDIDEYFGYRPRRDSFGYNPFVPDWDDDESEDEDEEDEEEDEDEK